MIIYEWDHDDLAYIEKKLGSMKKEIEKLYRKNVEQQIERFLNS